MGKIIRFLVVSFFLYLAWFLLYDLWLMPDGTLDQWLTNHVAKHSGLVLRGLGYNITHNVLIDRNVIKINDYKALHIAHGCNGLLLLALFTGFVLAFPGPFRKKLWFIPLGVLLIYLINIARVVSLVLVRLYFPQSLNFNHKYTFVLIVYACIFGLWMLWVNKFSGNAHIRHEGIN